MLEETGFENVRLSLREGSRDFIRQWLPGKGIENSIVSATIEAIKPMKKGQRSHGAGLGWRKMESKEVTKKVYGHYESGLHCAEVLARTVLEIFSEKGHAEVIRASSAFGGGIAGSTEELCGAFTEGVIALGYLLGREKPGDDLRDCGAVVKDFKGRFQDQFGSLNCRAILDGIAEQENPLGCVKLTAEAAVILVELLREFEHERDMRFDAYCSQPRDKVELGCCPFTSGSCYR